MLKKMGKSKYRMHLISESDQFYYDFLLDVRNYRIAVISDLLLRVKEQKLKGENSLIPECRRHMMRETFEER